MNTAKLIVTSSRNLAGQEFEIRDRALIGRGLDADVMLPDASVGRRHSEITFRGSSFHLTDLGSRNLTILNGRSLKPNASYPLSDGDEIRVCHFTFRFALAPSEETEWGEHVPASRSIQAIQDHLQILSRMYDMSARPDREVLAAALGRALQEVSASDLLQDVRGGKDDKMSSMLAESLLESLVERGLIDWSGFCARIPEINPNGRPLAVRQLMAALPADNETSASNLLTELLAHLATVKGDDAQIDEFTVQPSFVRGQKHHSRLHSPYRPSEPIRKISVRRADDYAPGDRHDRHQPPES